ncbi:MAG: hypothetical protein H6691_05920 [Gemmatimonadales bacterium]|nr:hypothetical protein [Gemmatimonadales bacterium]
MPGSRSLMFDDGSDERLIIRELDEVRAYLRELFGVDEKPFLRAERMGWLEWANRSDFDSPSFPGTLLWGHTVRHERAYFVQHEDWKKDNTNNFPTVVRPDGEIALVVETGDRFTGRVVPGHQPRTNSRKGAQTMRMIAMNRSQMNLPFPGDMNGIPLSSDAPLLWVHLINQSGGHIYGEVSLPIVANGHNRIIGWKVRLILPRWTNDDDMANLRANAPTPTGDAEVKIVRRAS